LVGCKNTFDVDLVNRDNEKYMIRSGSLKLEVENYKSFSSSRLTAGIHAHDLSIGREIITSQPNSYLCEIIDSIKGVFSDTLIVKCEGHVLQVNVSKNISKDIMKEKKQAYYLNFPSDKIFLMNENNG